MTVATTKAHTITFPGGLADTRPIEGISDWQLSELKDKGLVRTLDDGTILATFNRDEVMWWLINWLT